MFSKGNTRSANGASGPAAESQSRMPSIISASLTIDGNLQSAGDIQIDGKVNGDIRTTKLTISETGGVIGSIEADTVTVAGEVTGRIKAKDVTLTRTARVEADITQERLSVESGALFEGQSRALSREDASADGTGDVAGRKGPRLLHPQPPVVAPPAAASGAKKVTGNGSAVAPAQGGDGS